MPESIKFTASFGDKDKLVELAYIYGGYYHIYIDNYYYGQIHQQQGKWRVLLQNPETMTIDDIQIIEDIIEQSNPADS